MKNKIMLITILLLSSKFLLATNPEWIIYIQDSVHSYGGQSVDNIIVDSNNNKWVSGFGGVYKYNNNNWSNPLMEKYFNQYEPIYGFNDIIFNYDNSIWLIGNLLTRLRPGIDTIGIERENLPIIHFTGGVYFGGFLWISTEDSGIVRFDGTNYTTYNKHNGLFPANFINHLKVDTSGVFWMASDTGFIRWDRNTWTIYDTTSSAIPTLDIQSISIDKFGNKWLTFFYGENECKFAKYDGTNWTIFDSTSSSIFANNRFSGNINNIAFDNLGNKWIATIKGLVKYDDSTFTFYDIPVSGYRAKMCINLAVDKDDNIWVGTAECLAVFNPAGIHYTPMTKKEDNPVNTIMTKFYPNPTERKININYQIVQPGNVSCEIYDENGKFISKAFDRISCAGEFNETINTGNLSNGTYLFKMKIGNRIETKQIIITK